MHDHATNKHDQSSRHKVSGQPINLWTDLWEQAYEACDQEQSPR